VLEVAAESRVLSGLGLDLEIERDFLAKLRARRKREPETDAALMHTHSPRRGNRPARERKESLASATSNDFALPEPSDLDTLTEGAGAFDEDMAAKLERRYGSEVEGESWRWA
jgi:hypothetical protein